MNTDQIISMADPGGSASPDIDLRAVLKNMVIPEFLFDVRAASWRRRVATLSFSGTRSADAPDDLDSVLKIMAGDTAKLTYIGESDDKVMAALLDSAPASPTGYWIQAPGVATRYAIHLDCVPSAPITYSISYLPGLYWDEEQSALALDQYIPAPLQWTLVEGVKRELWRERAGVGDQRYVAAAAECERWKQRALNYRDLAPIGDNFRCTR
jgi:hypothetical protein